MILPPEIEKRTEQRLAQELLREELRMFEVNAPHWARQHGGKFALLGKQCFAGFHLTYEDAMRAGVRAFGPVQPFLIRQVPHASGDAHAY